MQSVQRHFGKLMKRSADDSQVAILLKDFDEANKLLGRIVDSTKAWRDAWSSLLSYQARILSELEGLYAPIIASSDSSTTDKAVQTPRETLARTANLAQEYEELRSELLQELEAINERIIKPATQAMDYMKPLEKTIKKRDDRKLDYERYQSRVDSYSKKTKRSDRDNSSLTKAESDLARATEEYQAADDHVRKCLPPVITAAFSLLPRLLAAQIEIQNTMLAHYYTVVQNYCEQEHFPSPSPPMEQIVHDWEQALHPTQQKVESLGCIANGKAVRLSPGSPDDQRNGHSSRLPNGLNFRRPSSSNASTAGPTSTSTSTPSLQPPASPGRRLSAPSVHDTKPTPVMETKPRLNSLASSPSSTLTVPTTHLSPQTPASASASSPAESYVSARTDYFSRNQHPSDSAATSPGYGVLAAAKKKPPPPPPKRVGSNQGLFVTALYDFGGQSAGDLAFREGDRIRVLKKTDSTDDWWEGELRGVKGSFPANYVE
ncbi:SH3 domain containing protein [Aspergillus bombycis]|uniref:SH3 domain containing protein n=1 Tax=Aspergillus bombycis TaxID=109264 RepID=A0A1F7ZT23_9EURO|nr:SH3 domain containing protein [Aspergillus bombycis]OGM42613.1 SH3 domain containing protein [Aspergillus bombycis]